LEHGHYLLRANLLTPTLNARTQSIKTLRVCLFLSGRLFEFTLSLFNIEFRSYLLIIVIV